MTSTAFSLILPRFLLSPLGRVTTSFSSIPAPPGRCGVSAPRLCAFTELQADTITANRDGDTILLAEEEKVVVPTIFNLLEETEPERLSINDYLQQTRELINEDGGGGSPRWFSPKDCGPPLQNSPSLLFLPGIDGVGLGLIMHHQKLGKIFDVWCLHIPVTDRTAFTDLVMLIETKVQAENQKSGGRPVYLVGESLGACLALAVAARNPDIDLVLILANPGTSFTRSPLQILTHALELMPDQLYFGLPYTLSLVAGNPLKMAMDTIGQGIPLQQLVGTPPQDLMVLLSNLSVLIDILPRETLLWKLKMLKSASTVANSHLHAVKAQTLILSSGRDQLFPSTEEAEQLCRALPNGDMRKFNDSGHLLFLEDSFDLVTTIKGAAFYRRGRYRNYVSDYIPPTPSEFKKIVDPLRWVESIISPVILSTLENGKIVRSLEGIPSEGPVLLVGYHMLLGLELVPMITRFLTERNILVRGIAHPMMFEKPDDGSLHEIAAYDTLRIMGAAPVSGVNFYKLFAAKSHVLLYPGGMREACHRKGEEYKLFWPEQSEFVRMAAKFGAKIIPFGVVGEDDIGEVVFDYDDIMKIPYLRAQIEENTKQRAKVRTDATGEVANQGIHMPGIRPKLPGRFYYLFGQPIETRGIYESKDREKCQELYLEVKSKVEWCLAYLKEKREKDAYRNILSRLGYQATNGLNSEVPSFEI